MSDFGIAARNSSVHHEVSTVVGIVEGEVDLDEERDDVDNVVEKAEGRGDLRLAFSCSSCRRVVVGDIEREDITVVVVVDWQMNQLRDKTETRTLIPESS
jgi:hypothetical protein